MVDAGPRALRRQHRSCERDVSGRQGVDAEEAALSRKHVRRRSFRRWAIDAGRLGDERGAGRILFLSNAETRAITPIQRES
jgi:hypothetical protein